MAFLPEARQAVKLTSDWFVDLFSDVSGLRYSKSTMNNKSVKEEKLLQRRRDTLATQHLEEPVDFDF